MKKILFLAVLAFMAASCEENDELYLFSQDLTVRSEHWKYYETDDEAYFYYTFKIPQITRSVCSVGQVTATRYLETGQSQLPEVRHFVYKNDKWTETVRYEYSPGEITFIVTYSVYDYRYNPVTMDFRIVVNGVDVR